MSNTETLLQHLRREQEIHRYSSTSRWANGLFNAIGHLEAALATNDPFDKFSNAWRAIYNITLIGKQRGDTENETLTRWFAEARQFPAVQQQCVALPGELLDAVWKVEGTLLWNKESRRPRDSRPLVEAWRDNQARGKALSPQKAIADALLLGRDLRNATSHADFNRHAPSIKKALEQAAAFYTALAEAAIEGTIGHPQPGTTGLTPAHRAFLYPYLKNSDAFFSDYYLENLLTENEPLAQSEADLKNSFKALAKSFNPRRDMLARADAVTLRRDWLPELFAALGLPARLLNTSGAPRLVSEDGIFAPAGALTWSGSAPQSEYAGREAGREIACWVWIVSHRTSSGNEGLESPLSIVVDERHTRVPVMDVARRALLASDVPWALVTDGHRLRLLSKSAAHRSLSYLEIDIAQALGNATASDENAQKNAREAWSYALRLFGAASFTVRDAQERTLLERVAKGSETHAETLGKELKKNVFNALQELGAGFLRAVRDENNADRVAEWMRLQNLAGSVEEYRKSSLLLDTVYHESMALMYRLLFAFYAESRDLLPMDDELYRESYSLEHLRVRIRDTHDMDDHSRYFGQGTQDLWEQVGEMFAYVRAKYNGGLFDPEIHLFLELFSLDDYHLARAIDLLSRTQPDSKRPGGRRFVTYRDLDVRHLGSIYEGILEYSGAVASEDLAIVRRGTGKKSEFYEALGDLTSKEKADLAAWQEAREASSGGVYNQTVGSVTGFVEAGEYYLVNGGRESKRKSSGSYYTPDYIVQYIVENTLGPLVRGEARPAPEALHPELQKRGAKAAPVASGPLSPEEILELKVLDPAMGSGHFLVAAADYLARSYGEALIREGRDADGKLSSDEVLSYRRKVVEKCIYGVDLNSMAVELAKLSLWLFTMSPSAPLSFLNHHLKPGNALIGAWITDLGALPNPKLKKKSAPRQAGLFESQFRARVPNMVGAVLDIMARDTTSHDDVKAKKAWDKALDETRKPFVHIADAWTAQYFGEDAAKDYDALLSDIERARPRHSAAADEHKFFHWELMFPEVWFERNGSRKERGGFDAVIGNPPYDVVSAKENARDVSQELLYFKRSSHFTVAMTGKTNLYKLFTASAFSLLHPNSMFSYIVPMGVIGDEQTRNLRGKLLKSLVSLDIFPQKDDAKRRVFEEAKLSTAIFILNIGRETETFTVRTHPGREIERESSILTLTEGDLTAFDPINLVIPSCNQTDWALALEILKRPIVRLSKFISPKQGEVNESGDKDCISFLSQEGELIIRGSSLTMFSVRESSQGEDLFLNTAKFLKDANKNSKAFDHTKRRAGFQRKAPQNNFRRLIASVIESGHFCLDSVSYVTETDSKIDLDVFVAYMNSEFADWYFRLFSAGGMINNYQIEAMPFPQITVAKGLDWLPLLQNNAWDDLRLSLGSICTKPGTMPEDAVAAIAACSHQISQIENKRDIMKRSERAALGSRSQLIQDVIDHTFFRALGISFEEEQYIRRRRAEML